MRNGDSGAGCPQSFPFLKVAAAVLHGPARQPTKAIAEVSRQRRLNKFALAHQWMSPGRAQTSARAVSPRCRPRWPVVKGQKLS